MKRALFKRRIHTCYLHKGLFALAVNLLLTSISLANLLTQGLPSRPVGMSKFS